MTGDGGKSGNSFTAEIAENAEKNAFFGLSAGTSFRAAKERDNERGKKEISVFSDATL
jgi:hypothetical protein